jgi:hypothetical protein
MLAIGCAVWAAWNGLSAQHNYAVARTLPEPVDWLAIIGPAAGAVAAFCAARWQPARKPELQTVLQALAALLNSGVGVELHALFDAMKSKGFPPQGSLSVTFPDGSTQSIDWNARRRSK